MEWGLATDRVGQEAAAPVLRLGLDRPRVLARLVRAPWAPAALVRRVPAAWALVIMSTAWVRGTWVPVAWVRAAWVPASTAWAPGCTAVPSRCSDKSSR